MPSRSSSESSKGRGRPRRPRIDSNSKSRSYDKSGDKNDKKSNEGSGFSKPSNRPNRPNRFRDSGKSSDKRGGERTPFSKNSNRPDRSEKFRDGGKSSDRRDSQRAPSSKNTTRPDRSDRYKERGERPERKNEAGGSHARRKFGDSGPAHKKPWRKSFTDDSSSNKPGFVKRSNDRDSFGSNKRTRSGDKEPYAKFDKAHIRKRTSEPHGSDKQSNSEKPADSGKIRLNRYIANSGVCSRREADELIKIGLISVNGVTITELGYKVNPNDEVRHEGKLLRREKPVYILMNKPKGFLTTTADPEDRNTVMHLIANFVKERVYPVGRLDRNTTGLLLLTNDGELAEKLMHPSYNVKKIYKVELDRPLTKGDAQRIVDGVRLEEGVAIVDDLAIVSEDRKTVGIELHIGWNRVVRRIFEALEYEVLKLDRTVYAGLTKKDLGRGEWRFLKPQELVILKHLQ